MHRLHVCTSVPGFQMKKRKAFLLGGALPPPPPLPLTLPLPLLSPLRAGVWKQWGKSWMKECTIIGIEETLVYHMSRGLLLLCNRNGRSFRRI